MTVTAMHNVAEEYGRALFELAAEGDGRAMEQDADTVLQALSAAPEYIRMLEAPEISGEEKRAALTRALEGAHPYLTNTLCLLLDRARAGLIPAVLEAFLRLAREARGEVTATVETAMPLTDEEKTALTAALSRKYQKTVTLREVVDARLLGGIRVYIEGQLLDDTLRHRLDDIGGRLAKTVL